ncbi:hypothetical protein CHELA41_24114 [Hyphomicrobiales bacterium]|nr:hypothetical protein CHELA41_24114 [Hyphomicrobiales bacterium]
MTGAPDRTIASEKKLAPKKPVKARPKQPTSPRCAVRHASPWLILARPVSGARVLHTCPEEKTGLGSAVDVIKIQS